MVDKNFKDNHHGIPKCREIDGYNVHHRKNITKMERVTHESIHKLYDVLVPHEQLELWIEWNKKILSHNTKRKLLQILQDPNFYDKDLLK